MFKRLFNNLYFITFTASRNTIFVSFVLFSGIIFLISLSESEDQTIIRLRDEALVNVGRNPNYSAVYRRSDKLDKNIKYILLWTPSDYAPFYYFKKGQRAFIEYSCPYYNCYVTDKRNFLPNITQYDAIAFNGRNLQKGKDKLPQIRSFHQKYIYVNTESAEYCPLCQPFFDDFFNWTATFKLKSDLPFLYFKVVDYNGNVVAPKPVVDWIKFEDMTPVDPAVSIMFRSKSKAAAWFVSNCRSKSNRETFVSSLIKELEFFNLTVDIYGNCGEHTCPRREEAKCMAKLEKEYFFYLSFENSFDEDYVTEKLLTALRHRTVPIVYGGALYKRFLPPNSYIDASDYKIKDLARLMAKLMHSPEVYKEYFRWTNHYIYLNKIKDNVCSLCAALNDKTKMSFSSYPDLRKWWNPNYRHYCKKNLLEDTLDRLL